MGATAGDPTTTGVVRAETVVDLFAASRSRLLVGDHSDTMVELTTQDLFDVGRQLADAFAASGVGPGDRIAVQMQNTELYLQLLAASAVGGFVVMSVNTRFSDALAANLTRRSGAVHTVRGPADLPPPISSGIGFASASPTWVAAPEDRFVIFTTSGTTSEPKLVVHNQRSIAHHAGDIAHEVGYTDTSCVLVPMPLCGTFGLTSFMAAIAGHSTVVLPAAFNTAGTAALIEHFAVTSIHGSDDMFARLDEHGADLSTITCSGYARFNSSLDGIVERVAERGASLRGLYGMSEVQALFSMRPADEDLETQWLAGGMLTSPEASYRVVDDELQLRGPSMFEGYLADGGADIDEVLTDAHFDDGWFRTGDLAAVESPRSFHYLTRMGDVLRLGGFLVAPAEIEGTMLEVPGVAAAQVVAVDLPSGARPVAFVIAAEVATPPDEAEVEAQVIAHCQQRLAKFKSPVRVITVDEFPTTDGPNGVKIQRARLREMASEILQA